jgi:hypothetical protein
MEEIPREKKNMFHSFSEPKDIKTQEIIIDDLGRINKKVSIKGHNNLVIRSRRSSGVGTS